MTISFPKGFRESLEFRRLLSMSGMTRAIATDVFVGVFETLAAASSEGGEVGLLLATDLPILTNVIGQQGIEAGAVVAFMADRCGFLLREGDNFRCPMFERNNRNSPLTGSMQSRGGKASAFQKRVKIVEQRSMGEVLAISGEFLVDASGQPLSKDVCERMHRLVVRCDLALGKRAHQPKEFTPELIQNAVTVVMAMTDDEIDKIIDLVIDNRPSQSAAGHPALQGMDTEKLIPRLNEIRVALSGKTA